MGILEFKQDMRVKFALGLLLAAVGSGLAGWQGTRLVWWTDNQGAWPYIASDNLGTPWIVIDQVPGWFTSWNGSSWDSVRPMPDTIQLIFYMDLIFDEANRLFLVYAAHDRQDHDDVYSTRYDRTSQKWELPKLINRPDTTKFRNFYPRIASGGGQIWAAWFWYDTARVVDNIKVSHWDDAGGRWEPEMTVNPDTSGINHLNWFPDIAVDASGRPYVVWTKQTPSVVGTLLWSRYQGDTWTKPSEVVSPDSVVPMSAYSGVRPKLVFDSRNYLHCVFPGFAPPDSTRWQIWYTCFDGTAWKRPINPDTLAGPPNGPICFDVDIGVHAPDDIWATWDGKVPGWDCYIYASHFDGTQWTRKERIDGGMTYDGGYMKMALDGAGSPFVVWGTDTNNSYPYWQVWYNRYVSSASAEDPTRQTAPDRLLSATVLRGVLTLPPASSFRPQASSYLMDISGRKVLNLHSGANDVSRLAPGIYFVRSAGSGQRWAVRKIVIQH